MVVLAPGQASWLVQPLVDVGLGPAQIQDLVVRLAFQTIVAEGGDTFAAAGALVAGQPAAVRAAWGETIGRLLYREHQSPGAAGPG